MSTSPARRIADGDRAASADPLALLNTAAVSRLIGVSRVTLWRWTHAGFFPPPDKLLRGHPPRKAWLRTTVEQWITAEVSR